MQEGNCGERDARKKLWRIGRGKWTVGKGRRGGNCGEREARRDEGTGVNCRSKDVTRTKKQQHTTKT